MPSEYKDADEMLDDSVTKGDEYVAEDEESSDETYKEENTMVEKTQSLSRMEALLEKAVGAIEALNTENQMLKKQQEKFEAKISKLMAGTHVPPEMDVEDAGESEKPEVRGKKSAEGTTKSPPDLTAGEIAIKKGVSQDALAKMISKVVDERLASTPAPTGAGKSGTGTFDMIRKAVAEDRAINGGARGGDNPGIASGQGNEQARFHMAKFMTKMSEGAY